VNRFVLPAPGRFFGSAALLILLTVCAYAGTEAPAKTVSVPVESVVLSAELAGEDSVEKTRQKLRLERERELSLLDSVADHPDAAQETRRNALQQKMSLARRMEQEAAIEAALAYMGLADAAVICGAQEVAVFVPVGVAGDEKSRIRIIDAAVSHAEVSADDVQIILAKK